MQHVKFFYTTNSVWLYKIKTTMKVTLSFLLVAMCAGFAAAARLGDTTQRLQVASPSECVKEFAGNSFEEVNQVFTDLMGVLTEAEKDEAFMSSPKSTRSRRFESRRMTL